MNKLEKELRILIAELEPIERSLIWPMAGYEQEVLGNKRFCCKVCGHCPAALIERLKLMLEEEPTKTNQETM